MIFKMISAGLLASAMVVFPAVGHASSSGHLVRASFYKHGKQTANGERFNPNGLTCAHRSLPFGTRIRVTNRNTGRSVVVRVNDRGPFIAGREIDLTFGAARAIRMLGNGVASVYMQIVH